MKEHKSRPEPVLFLLLARDAMKSYHSKNQKYAEHWTDLGIEFSSGPFHSGDAETRPNSAEKTAWRPLGCEFLYEIQRASKDRFRIVALDRAGNVKFALEESMSEPIEVDNTPFSALNEPLPGKIVRIIQAATPEALKKIKNLDQYRITVYDDNSILNGKPNPAFVVTFIDINAPWPQSGLGNPGKIPGLEVKLNKETLAVINSNFIR